MDTIATFSPAQVVAAIPTAEPTLLMRRVRHWTMSGILPTAERLHPGSGRQRHYTRDAVYFAALLNHLSDWGLPIRALEPISRDLAETVGLPGEPGRWGWEERRLWEAAISGSETVYLFAGVSAAAESADPAAALTFLQLTVEGEGLHVNLTRLFAGVRLPS
jgi:hypothetical protein